MTTHRPSPSDDLPRPPVETRDVPGLNQAEACSCDKCVSLCKRNPGWMTPQEAMLAIADGQGTRLMRDWLEPGSKLGNQERLYVLAAASIYCEGSNAPEFASWQLILGECTKGCCTFLKEGLCELHATAYKPKQCRESMGCRPPRGPDNYEMGRLWDTEEGREALALWSSSLQ